MTAKEWLKACIIQGCPGLNASGWTEAEFERSLDASHWIWKEVSGYRAFKRISVKSRKKLLKSIQKELLNGTWS